MVHSEVLVGDTEYLTLYARCRINLCRYNRVRLYFLYFYLLVLTIYSYYVPGNGRNLFPTAVISSLLNGS